MSTTKFYERDLGTASRPINNLNANNINNVPVVKTIAGIGMKNTTGTMVETLTIPNNVETDGTVILSDAVTPPISGTFVVPGGLTAKSVYKLTMRYIFKAPSSVASYTRYIGLILKYNGVQVASVEDLALPVFASLTPARIDALVIVSDISGGKITTNGTLGAVLMRDNAGTVYGFDNSDDPGLGLSLIKDDPGTTNDTGFELYVNNNGNDMTFKLTNATLDY